MGTLVVNVTGCFIIGLFATLTATEGRWLVGPFGRNFFMTGVCGRLHNLFFLSLQTLNLARDEEWLYAARNAGMASFYIARPS